MDLPKGDGIPRAIAAFPTAMVERSLSGSATTSEKLLGIEGDTASFCDRLDNVVRNNVYPPPKYEKLPCTLEGRSVIAMRVEAGDDCPYGVGTRGSHYVRRGANNWVAQPEEMRKIARDRQPNDGEPIR